MFPIPKSGQYRFTLKSGMDGIGVYALQTGLNSLEVSSNVLAPDGKYGPRTANRISAFQSSKKLAIDGIAGPRTQDKLVDHICDARQVQFPSMPSGLLAAVTSYESGHILEAVNYQNYLGSIVISCHYSTLKSTHIN